MIFLKLFQNILMPSTFILLFFITGFIFLKKRKKKMGQILVVSGVIFYFLFSIGPVSDFLLMSLEEKYSSVGVEEVERADTAVLLLGGRESDVLRGSEAVRIWHLAGGNMRIIVSGTDPLTTDIREAHAVRNFFIHRGVSESDIVIEGESRNTRENVENVKKIVGKDNPFLLVTSAYHMDRAVREFRRLGANPIPAPTDFKRKRVLRYGFFDFIPRGDNLRNSDLAFHEYIGTIYYRLMFLAGR